jgi:hypothetical protein
MEGVVEYNPLEIYQTYLRNLQTTNKYAGMSAEQIIAALFQSDQVYEGDDGFFVYRVPDPFYGDFHKSFVFQDDRTFIDDWYNACDTYIKSLSRRDLYILKRYTRHGDEIVNKLLREPDTFVKNTRIQDLIFNKMPDERFMLYAMQLIDMFHPGAHSHYVNVDGTISAMSYHDIEVFEEDFFGSDGNTNAMNAKDKLEKLLPLIYTYIEDLREILRNAPTLPKPLQVFRATNTDYLNRPYEAASVHGFLSTSLDSCIGEYYHANQYVYQIILQPGTPCLSIKNASQYYNEFEVLVDTNCFAMPSVLYDKHTLQTDIHSGEVDPIHVLSEPRNIKHNVRHIEIVGSVGSDVSRISPAKSKSSKGSRRGSRGSRGSRGRRGSKGGRLLAHKSHTHSHRSRTKKMSRKVTALRISRKTTMKLTRKDAWKYRDQSAPRIVYGTVPAEVKVKLLNAHKKMGTYLHNVSR